MNHHPTIHPTIHQTAIIDPSCSIGENTSIGPYSIIGEGVKLGKNNKIGPHVVIEGNTQIGDNNTIFQFASIGSQPQDLKYKGDKTPLKIGDNNIIREYVTIQPATEMSGVTKIGNGNLFMVSSHIAHDVIVGNGCWFANSVAVAGHITIGNNVIFGGLSGAHQNINVGDCAFIAAGSMVSQDVPPFCLVQGDRAKICHINKIGMQRKGIDEQEINKLQIFFRKLFWGSGIFDDRLRRYESEFEDFALAKQMIDFIKNSARGICPSRQSKE